MLGRGFGYDQSPVKTLDAEFKWASLSRNIVHMSLHFLLLAKGPHSCVPSPGGGSVTESVHAFSRFCLVSSSFAQPIGYPFAIINFSHELLATYQMFACSLRPQYMFSGRPIAIKEEWETLQ